MTTASSIPPLEPESLSALETTETPDTEHFPPLSSADVETIADAPLAAPVEVVLDESHSSDPADNSAESAETVAEAEPTTAEESPIIPPADPLAQARESLLRRVTESSALPRGIRGRLASALGQVALVQHEGQLLAPVDALLGVLEAWAPEALRVDPRSLQRPDHPEGDAFFTGDPSALSDEQAERIARRQLQRSGYLPTGG